MRTTYKPQNSTINNNVPKETVVTERVSTQQSAPQQNTLSVDNSRKIHEYVNLYKTMVEEAELINSVSDAFNNSSQGIQEQVQQTSEVNRPPKRKKKRTLLVVLILVLSLAGTGIYYFKSTKEKKQNDFIELSNSINRLYTDDSKTDIKSDVTQEYLQGIYEECARQNQQGTDTQSILEELDTISMFLVDKTAILALSDPSYDFRTEGFLEQLNSIKDNTSKYKISGLTLTITNMVAVIQSEYDSYTSVLQELQGIADFVNLDTEKYEGLIRGITHQPNKTEVSELYASVLVKHTEEVGKQKAKDKAKKKADKAKDDALSKAESAKKEAEKAKEEAEKKLDELLNKSTEEASTENNEEASTEVKSE